MSPGVVSVLAQMTIPAWLSTVLRVLVAALLALLAQTYLWSPGVPLVLKGGVVAIGILAAVWPAAGLLVFAGVTPLARVISYRVFDSPATARFTEALVLAFLAGWVFSRVRRQSRERSLWPGSSSALLLAAMLAASVLVEMGVLRYWKDYWGPYFQLIAVYVGRDYLTLAVDVRPWAGGVSGLVAPQAAALFLEGIALMWVVLLSCARDAVLGRRLVFVSVAAAVGAAALSLALGARVWSASGMLLLDFINDRRLSVHTGKVNVAASYYVLFLPVAGALAWGRLGRIRSAGTWARRLVPALAAVGALMMLGALWMTGSRSALMALIGVLVAAMVVMAVTRLRDRQRDAGRRDEGRGFGLGVWMAAAAGLVVIALLLYALHVRSGGDSRTWPILLALKVRLRLWTAAMSMVAAHPLFGVGIGQFRGASVAYLDEMLHTYWGNVGFPAHNQFLQMTGEIGLLGGFLFAAMFAGILWRAWIVVRWSHDAVLGGVIAGLVAFLITCLAGNPLAVEVVAYPFWIMLGVALAAGATGAPPDGGRVFRPSTWRNPGAPWRRRLLAAFLVLLAASIPVRVWKGTESVNYALAHYGLDDEWSRDGTGREFKLVREEAAFFVYGLTYWLDVPVGRDVQAGQKPVEVDILLDGRIARHLTLADDTWQTAGFMIPPDPNRPYRRIDLKVSAPSGVPPIARLGRPDAKR